MTQSELDLLIAGNQEVPVKNVLILAKTSIKLVTDTGIQLSQKDVQDQINKKEPMYVIASSEGSIFTPGTIVRVASFMVMNPPLESSVEGYDLVLCREHDVLTYKQ